MVTAEHGIDTHTSAQITPVSDDAIADEIRVNQSVHVQRGMPVLLSGNALAVAIFCYMDWPAVVQSHAIFFLVGELILLAPMLRSYLRLRRRPRPSRVSKRRIRVIELYSVLMGLVWALAIVLLLPFLTKIDGAVVMMCAFFLGYGSVALTPSIPLASAAYFLPILLTTFAATYFNEILRGDLLILIFVAGSSAMARTVWLNWQDVTANVRISLERLEAETELHRREAEEAEAMRAMIEALPFPLVMTRANGALEASEQASRQFGTPVGDLTGLSIREFLCDPADLERMLDIRQEQGRIDEYEVQFRDASGNPFWALLSSRPLKYQGEDCWLNAIYVIDARKRAEEALAEKEAQLRLALAQMPGGMMLGDRDMNCVLINAQYRELFDFPDGLLDVGGSIRDALRYQVERGDFGPGDADDLIAEPIAIYQRNETVNYERTIGGSERTLQVNLAPTPDGGCVFIATDITELKRREKELAEKEAQLRVALDNMPGGIRFVDRDLNYVLFNARYSQLCEFPDGLLAVGGSAYEELRYQAERGDFGPGDKDKLIERVIGASLTGAAVSYERVIAGSGRTLQIDVAPTPEGGNVSILTDVTERKRSEEALANKEAQLRIALENMPGGLALNDGSLVYTVVNQQARDLLELPDDLMVPGGSIEDVVRYSAARGDYGPGEVDDLVDQRLEAVRTGGQLTIETQLPNGRCINIRRQLLDGGGNVSIFVDITERKQIETARARAEQQALEKTRILELTLENMGQGLTMYDAEWNLVSHNRQYAVHFDLPDDVFDGERTFDDVVGATMRHDYGDEWQQRLSVVRDPSRMTDVWRREFARPDGRSLDLLSNPIPSGGFVVTSTDITERKRAEDALRDQNRFIELLHRITATANEAETVEEAIKICLDEISADTGWPVGHAYLHRPEDGIDLVPSKVWHLAEPDRFATFREVTERTAFKRGEGLPGRVLGTGRPVWIADVTEDANFPRAKLAADIGVKAGFAFPVVAGDRIFAVLEFFATDSVEPDQRTLDIMANIGALLGSVILRKQSEQQLRASEQRLADILDSAPIAISIVRQDGTRLFVNSRAASLTGRDKADLIGAKSQSSYIDPALRDQIMERYKADGYVRDVEAEFQRADGTRYWVLITYQATTFADEKAILAWFYDITERKQAEAELATKQAQLQAALDNMSDGIFMLDSDLTFVMFNQRYVDLVGMPEALFDVGKPIGDVLTYAAENGFYGPGDAKEQVGQRIASYEDDCYLEIELETHLGRTIALRKSAIEGGGAVAVLSDITERKRIETEAQEAKDRAESALQELKSTQQILVQQEKMASLGQLTAGIAHELKNPLNFITNFAAGSEELIAELATLAEAPRGDMQAEDRAAFDEITLLLEDSLKKISHHGGRADAIIRGMLDHSRSGQGEWQEVEINQLVEQALNLAFHGAKAKDSTFNVTIERAFPEATGRATVMPQELSSVLLNLIGNAFDATRAREAAEPGHQPSVRVRTERSADSVDISVRDNGTGMTPEVRDRLFEPFFTTKPPGEGTGLGLSLSYDIVTHQHGGTITVESEPGEFAEFHVRLPLAPRAGRGTESMGNSG